MLLRFKTAYTSHLWMRRGVWSILVLFACMLFWSGGFPPRVWLLLIEVLPQVHGLWAARGAVVLLPLSLLVVQSLAWLVAWGGLLAAAIVHIQRCWQCADDNTHANEWLKGEDDFPLQEDALIVSQQRQQGQKEQRGQSRSLFDRVQPPLVLSANMQTKPRFVSPPPPVHSHYAHNWQRQLTFRMDIGVHWDAGIKRKDRPNEDSLVAFQGSCIYNNILSPFGFFMVADGMGGHAAGQDASYLAIKTVLGVVLPSIVGSDRMSDEIIVDLLADGIQRANQVIYRRGQKLGAGMGTTITVALVIDKMAFIANVGDSRTYLLREGEELTQITKDHSYVTRLVDTGQIMPEDVYTHPDRNQLYRGLGEKNGVEVDWFSVPLEVHDRLLLCSDGLWEMVRDRDIEKILRDTGYTTAQTSRALIQAALEGGGVDNISSIVVHMAPVTA